MKATSNRARDTALWLLCTATVAALTTAAPADAQLPIIQVIESQRTVRASASHESDFANLQMTSNGAGLFLEHEITALGLGVLGSEAIAEASQNTQISNFSARGEGAVFAIATPGGKGGNASSNGKSEVVLSVTLPVDAPFTLSGNLSASGATGPSPFAATANVSVAGFSPDGSVFFRLLILDSDDPPEDGAFLITETVKAGTNLQVSIEADARPGSNDYFGEAAAAFDFILDFGDRDGDGLLDSWEEQGLDFDGLLPIDINLPALGADPDVKDIFVEVDRMAGAHFDQSILNGVTVVTGMAFADAPADLVDNVGGAPGVNLHVVVDSDRPVHQPLLLLPGDDDLPAEFYAIKDLHFGSPSDRAHANSAEILAAKALIFRYGLWADTLIDAVNPANTRTPLGRAARIPSDGFIIAAGTIARSPSLAQFVGPATAGVFMHELGHTLGLRHGGQDDLNFKPNYLSVMNYGYDIPLNKITNQGTNAATVFRLDYSRSDAGLVLNENQLVEFDGLGGPANRKILFNSAGPGQPSEINIEWANSTVVNWNNNGDPAETMPYALDITRVSPLDTVEIYSPALTNYSDWDVLQYDLSGPTATRSQHRGVLPPVEPCIDQETIEAMLLADWDDHTSSSLIFEDGFESGDAGAWQ